MWGKLNRNIAIQEERIALLWHSGVNWLPSRPTKQPHREHPAITSHGPAPFPKGAPLSLLTDSGRTFRVKACGGSTVVSVMIHSVPAPFACLALRYNQHLLILLHCCSGVFKPDSLVPAQKSITVNGHKPLCLQLSLIQWLFSREKQTLIKELLYVLTLVPPGTNTVLTPHQNLSNWPQKEMKL